MPCAGNPHIIFSSALTDSLWIVGRDGVPGGLVPLQVWLHYEGSGRSDSIGTFGMVFTWNAGVCTVEAVSLGADFYQGCPWFCWPKIDNQGTEGPPAIPKVGVEATTPTPPWCPPGIEGGTHLAVTLDVRVLSTAEPGDSVCFDTLMMAFSPPMYLVFIDETGGWHLYYPSFSPGCITVVPCTCGDCNGDGRITVADALYTSGDIYRDGDAPACEGDVNQDGRLSIADAIYLLTHIYRGGPEPCNPP